MPGRSAGALDFCLEVKKLVLNNQRTPPSTRKKKDGALLCQKKEMATNRLPFNYQIDNLIMSASWELSQEHALQYLHEYLNQIDLLASGVEYKELGLSDRRESLLPILLDQSHQVISQRAGIFADHQATPANSIGVIKIDGAMRVQDGLSSRGIEAMAQDLQDAYNNPNIGGIFLEIRSGGGEALAGTILYNTLQEANKPVVTFTNLLASAAVKGTLPSTKIIASSPEIQIGSIGTMVSVDKRLLSYYQERYLDIYATGSSNKNEEFRALLAGDRGPIVQQLDQANEIFLDMVRKNRRLAGDEQRINETLSGRLFQAEEAMDRGLIDSIQTRQKALESLSTIINENRSSGRQLFFNQKSTDMNFLKRIQQALAGKFGLDFSQAETEDLTVEVIEKAKSLEEQIQQIRQEVKEEMQEQLEQKTGGTAEDLQELRQMIEKQNQRIDQLQSSRDELQKELAEYKNDSVDRTKDGKSKLGNSPAPNLAQFETAQKFYSEVQIEGQSKY